MYTWYNRVPFIGNETNIETQSIKYVSKILDKTLESLSVEMELGWHLIS